MEDVDDEVTEIEQNPAPFGTALPAQWLRAGLKESLLDAVRDSENVALVATAREEERIRQRERSGDIQRDDVVCLLVIRSGRCEVDEFECASGSGHAVPFSLPGSVRPVGRQ